MPFDPKLIHPDEPPLKADGEIDLPADLAALGEQLHGDAVHLAACYRATDPDRARCEHRGEIREPINLAAPVATRFRRWTTFAALASTVAAAVLAATTLLVAAIAFQRFGPVEQSPLAVSEAPAAPRKATEAISEGSPIPQVRSSSTTISLSDLSGPELEALLDLWQREPQKSESAGISF